MSTNIVVAAFGEFREVRTRALYKWDYGQILRFEGLDLPDTYIVHFSNDKVGDESVTMIGNADGVEIPNECLTTGQPVYAWVYLNAGADDGETVYSVIIPVKKRPRPCGDEPTPVQQGAIEQAIAALNTGVAAAQEAAQDAEQIASDLGDFDTAMRAVTAAKEEAAGSAANASTAAGEAADSAAEAAEILENMRTEGAAQISAIDAKGREVRESIPEEYADLSADVDDLKSHLEQIEKGYTPLDASDIIQGSFDAYGNIRQNSKRIRNSGMIDIKAGDTLSFTPGQTVKTILYGIFTTAGTYVSDNGWYPGLEKTFTEDCKIICVFENGLDTDLTPEEYDATTKIIPPVGENVRKYVDAVSEKVDTMYMIDNYFDAANIEYPNSKMLGNGTILADQDYDVFYIDLGSVKTSVYMAGALELMTFRFFNASGAAISAMQFYVDKAPGEMTLPTGTRFIRFGCKKTYQPFFMVTDTPCYTYTPHYDLNTVVLNAAQNWWAGKVGDSLGDSLTGQRFFQLYTKKYFGLDKFYIHGIGGTKMSGPANQYGDSMWMDSRINALSTDADFVTVLGGQNDGDVAIGDISKSNIDTDTYAGALNTVINKIYAHCKAGVVIILCTPFYVPAAGGERYERFDEAVRGIAKLHGLPVADFGGLSTADENTADLYWGTDRTHPIEKFYREKIAPILISTMENIRPVDWDRINNYGKFIDGIQYLP